MYVVYVIHSGNRTYCGKTNNFARRLRQHNGEIVGGAKYTRTATNWAPLIVIRGFQTNSEALKAEWKMRNVYNRRLYANSSQVLPTSQSKRIATLNYILNSCDKWTKSSSNIVVSDLEIYVNPIFGNLALEVV